jgi:hypothetical protein
MSDDPKKVSTRGLRVGDFNVLPVPVSRTSNALDTEADRERARRAEEDQRAAQHGGGGEAEAEAAPEEARAAVGQAIEKGRARAASGGSVGEETPILLRDPVTGATIKLP